MNLKKLLFSLVYLGSSCCAEEFYLKNVDIAPLPKPFNHFQIFLPNATVVSGTSKGRFVAFDPPINLTTETTSYLSPLTPSTYETYDGKNGTVVVTLYNHKDNQPVFYHSHLTALTIPAIKASRKSLRHFSVEEQQTTYLGLYIKIQNENIKSKETIRDILTLNIAGIDKPVLSSHFLNNIPKSQLTK